MTKLEKLMADLLSPKFEEWKSHLTEAEQQVFFLFYFKRYSIIQITFEVNYSRSQVVRILRSARKKIYKLIP